MKRMRQLSNAVATHYLCYLANLTKEFHSKHGYSLSHILKYSIFTVQVFHIAICSYALPK